MKEIWKDVEGFEGSYQVSNKGRVRSLDRLTNRGHRRRGIVLKPGVDGSGHHFVNLSLEGIIYMRKVHILVLEAFVGPRPVGKISRHGKKGANDNSVENLCWGTHRENQLDRFRDGTIKSRKIKDSKGVVYLSINQATLKTGVGRRHIWDVLNGKRISAGKLKWSYI